MTDVTLRHNPVDKCIDLGDHISEFDLSQMSNEQAAQMKDLAEMQ